jgi:hypothetical protein
MNLVDLIASPWDWMQRQASWFFVQRCGSYVRAAKHCLMVLLAVASLGWISGNLIGLD